MRQRRAVAAAALFALTHGAANAAGPYSPAFDGVTINTPSATLSEGLVQTQGYAGPLTFAFPYTVRAGSRFQFGAQSGRDVWNQANNLPGKQMFDVVQSALTVAPGTTVAQPNGFASYIENDSGQSGSGPNPVGFFTYQICGAATIGCYNWWYNSIQRDVPARSSTAVRGTTNGITAAGDTTLNFDATPTVVLAGVGAQTIPNKWFVYDKTSPSVIAAGATVSSVTGTTVVMSDAAIGGGVGSGDVLVFSASCADCGDGALITGEGDYGVDNNTTNILAQQYNLSGPVQPNIANIFIRNGSAGSQWTLADVWSSGCCQTAWQVGMTGLTAGVSMSSMPVGFLWADSGGSTVHGLSLQAVARGAQGDLKILGGSGGVVGNLQLGVEGAAIFEPNHAGNGWVSLATADASDNVILNNGGTTVLSLGGSTPGAVLTATGGTYALDLALSTSTNGIRLGSAKAVKFRNAANSADLVGITSDASDNLIVGNNAKPVILGNFSNGNEAILYSTGHLRYVGTAPGVSVCGTSPPAATGADNDFEFTTGTAAPTACTITFANGFGSSPRCVLTTETVGITSYYISAKSASAITVTYAPATSSAVFNARCSGGNA